MTEQSKKGNWFKIALGVLVTVYGILAALVAYQSSQLNNSARKMTFIGIMEMTRGNDAYAVADTQASNDFNALTQMILIDETGGNEVAWQVWEDSLTEAGFAALERGNDLDDRYYDEVYAWPNELYENANLAYETAQEFDAAGNSYDLVALMIALGVSFAAWASLLEEMRTVRVVFALISSGVLLISGGLWLLAVFASLPPEVLPL